MLGRGRGGAKGRQEDRLEAFSDRRHDALPVRQIPARGIIHIAEGG